ncbi:MAG: plasma-membrane proton-efflux P-type ATPase [Nitrosopumilaceae archaeon]
MKKLTGVDDLNAVPIDELYEKLSSNRNGLSSSEAKNRLIKSGFNEINEKKINPIKKFFGYFWGPIPWMIEAAVVISAIIGNWHDFIIILLLLFVNVAVGFWHEYNASNAIELLKQKLAIKAKVFRNNRWIEIPSRELVSGDIVRVRIGDIVPADVKLLDDGYLLADESTLTGESLPVEKNAYDLSFSGSVIRKGETDALVVSTGINTFFGKTAKLIQETKTRSHFQKALIKIGNYLIILAIVLVTLIFIVSMLRQQGFPETLQFALVLIVAAIPIALPAILSVSMAIGASKLTKKQAIVSKLASIEELAGIDILCADKTGTLTKNKLTAGDPHPYDNFSKEDILLFAGLASRKEDRDPIDDVIIRKIEESKLSDSLESFGKKSFIPFDPVIKRSEVTVVNDDGEIFKVSKGAFQVISTLVSNQNKITDIIKKDVEKFASEGYRIIGIAKTNKEGIWKFVGLLPFFDPLREDSTRTLKIANTLGVKIKMLTGDHMSIAKQVAKKLGLGINIQNASKLDENAQEVGCIEDADGFAQVFPEHKHRIIKILQDRGHIVGMTGDGVNDAPALKTADVGIAVQNSTDAAKSAADIVLTESGISVIIDAIKESRRVFQRMKNYAIYRIGETIRILLFLALSIVAFDFYPVTAIMIVLLALLNDIPIMTIAFDKVRFSQMPERWNMRNILTIATIFGIIGVISSFTLLYIGKEIFLLSTETLQSLIYLKLSVAGHMFLFVARTRGNFWTVRPSPLLFMAIVSTQMIATLITVYGIIIPPIGWNLAFFVWGFSFMTFLLTDFAKILLYKFVKPDNN